jgi:hypothetical protein
MDNYGSAENCNLVGPLSIVAQIALGLIIAASMLGIRRLTSQATPGKSQKAVASVPSRHFKTVHIVHRCAHGELETFNSAFR